MIKVKQALNWMDKYMKCNVSTAPVLLGKNQDKHYVFSTNVRSDKSKEFLKDIELNVRALYNTWNVIGVRNGDNNEPVGSWKNARHMNCNYPGSISI